MSRTPPTTPTGRSRVGLAMLYLGAAATVTAIALSLSEPVRSLLGEHVASGYPGYAPDAIGAAASAYVAILVTIGALGLLGWAAALITAHRNSRAARPLMAILLGLGLVIAVSGLTIQDTSGDVGLAPVLGWLLLVPCLPGAAALATWKRAT